MKQIVINRSYNEFCISHQALIRLRELGQGEACRTFCGGGTISSSVRNASGHPK